MEFIIISIIAVLFIIITFISGIEATDEDRLYKSYANELEELLAEEEFLERYLEENGLELKFKTFKSVSTFSVSSDITKPIKW